MSTPSSTRARLADLALAVYLAPLIEGRRVAVVGPASGEVARRARVLGASMVVSFGGVGEDIAVRALVPGALAGMYGKVDVIVVPDAGAVPSLVAVLDEARRALGSEGIIVVASEPDDGAIPLERGGKRSLGYYDLEDLCQARFATVRMLGRGPFLGYALATLDEGADGVTLDTRLLDGDPPKPEAFVAIASDTEVSLDPLAVVQIPSEVVDEVRAAATKALDEELARKDQKLKEAEAASAERWVKVQRYEHGLKELEEENRKSRDKAVRLSKELEDERKLRQRIELDAQMTRRAPELPKTPDLEPELRKLRDAQARAQKELADARAEAATARQDAAGARHVAQTTGADLEATRRELEGARARAQAATARVQDLERELDETQAAEADLRAQLDEALERTEVVDLTPELDALKAKHTAQRAELDAVAAKHAVQRAQLDALKSENADLRAQLDALRVQHEAARAEVRAVREELRAERASALVDGEYARVERALAEQTAELLRVRAERQRFEQSVRELALTIDRMQRADAAQEAAELRSRLSQMASVHAALADRADALARENLALRERVQHAEAQSVIQAGEAQQARWRVGELEAEVSRLGAAATPAAPEPAPTAAAEPAPTTTEPAPTAAAEPSASVDEGRAGGLEAALELARAATEEQHQALLQARDEVSRLYAANVGLEARYLHASVELDGARSGYLRRVAELEREIDRLVRALETSGAQSGFESRAAHKAITKDLQAALAEREGMAFRLREAEEALRELSAARAPDAAATPSVVVTVIDEDSPSLGASLLDDEPSGVSQARFEQVLADLSATAGRLAELEERLGQTRAELDEARSREAAAPAPSAPDPKLAGEVEVLRARVEELEADRGRHAADVESLVSQLTDRDLRLTSLERRREEELAGINRSLSMESQANRALRTSLEAVRAGLSAILVDGRGAMVAHDLMTLLRRIEEAG